MQIKELWQELDDEQAEKISGGDCDQGCIAWSIGFADVVRPSSSQPPNTVAQPIGKIRGTLILP